MSHRLATDQGHCQRLRGGGLSLFPALKHLRGPP